MNNINTKEYWDSRFKLNWNGNGVRQTREYAMANTVQMKVSKDFSGTILDFGCALGNAIPIYKQAFPKAKLSGIDLSDVAILRCKKDFGDLANFFVGDYQQVPKCDIIIASHVMEHITDDLFIVSSLLTKCKDLFIFVPYKESPLFHEHVNYYDENYYDKFSVIDRKVFKVKYEYALPIKGVIKNILNGKISNKIAFSKEIIMFRLNGLR